MEKYGNFEISFETRSSRTMKCNKKLGKLIFLERRLEGKSMELKIIEFGSRFAEKLLSE